MVKNDDLNKIKFSIPSSSTAQKKKKKKLDINNVDGIYVMYTFKIFRIIIKKIDTY